MSGKDKTEEWAKVIGRKSKVKKGAGKEETRGQGGETDEPEKKGEKEKGGGKANTDRRGEEKKEVAGKGGNVSARGGQRRNVPRYAAVTVTCKEGRYAEVMAEARKRIDLKELGIPHLLVKRGITGSIILEIPGEESKAGADKLAEALRGTLREEPGVTIGRPEKRGEIRIWGIEPSVTEEEIRGAIAEAGGCSREEIKVGQKKIMIRGLGVVWARCPLQAAVKIGGLRSLRIGWGSAGVELLQERPLQCFRCLERGHVRAQCRSKEDRSDNCYRCGVRGHLAKECGSAEHCILCSEEGRQAGHRMGGLMCTVGQRRLRQDGGGTDVEGNVTGGPGKEGPGSSRPVAPEEGGMQWEALPQRRGARVHKEGEEMVDGDGTEEATEAEERDERAGPEEAGEPSNR